MAKIEFILNNIPDKAYNKSENSNLYKLLSAISSKYDEYTEDIETVRNSKFIDYAKGSDLDKLGKILNLNRFKNENDITFRGRIKSRVPSFIGGGTLESIKQVIRNLLGVEPMIIEHYKPGDGHAYFDNGVFRNLDITNQGGLNIDISNGIWYIEGNKYEKTNSSSFTLNANSSNYIVGKNDGTIVSKTTPNISGEVLIANITTDSSSITNIVDERIFLNPEEDYITNVATITIQIPYEFSEDKVNFEDARSIIKNTKGAGISALMRVIGVYKDSFEISEYKPSTSFLVGFSGVGSDSYIGGQ
jgi:hypothetical protein